MPVGQPSAAVGPSEVALVEEVTALKALLASVAPQLQELAGMKQQMGQLLTLLQPATAGQQETYLQCARVLNLSPLQQRGLPILMIAEQFDQPIGLSESPCILLQFMSCTALQQLI